MSLNWVLDAEGARTSRPTMDATKDPIQRHGGSPRRTVETVPRRWVGPGSLSRGRFCRSDESNCTLGMKRLTRVTRGIDGWSWNHPRGEVDNLIDGRHGVFTAGR